MNRIELEARKAELEQKIVHQTVEIEAIDRRLEGMKSFEVVSASGTLWKFKSDGKTIDAKPCGRDGLGLGIYTLFCSRAEVRSFCDRLLLLSEGFENE
jgi:hypothetical protein